MVDDKGLEQSTLLIDLTWVFDTGDDLMWGKQMSDDGESDKSLDLASSRVTGDRWDWCQQIWAKGFTWSIGRLMLWRECP